MRDIRRHNPFEWRSAGHSDLVAAAWLQQRQREEAYMRAEDLRQARRKNRVLMVLSIVAAACVVVGSGHVAGEAASLGEPAECETGTGATPDHGDAR